MVLLFNFAKKLSVFGGIVLLVIFSSSTVSAAQILVLPSKNIGEKKIISPSKIILVKIKPKISNPQKLVEAADILFVEQLKLTQNVFSYIAIDNQIFRLRDLNVSYSKNIDDSKIVYIAYTTTVPMNLIADLMTVHNIRSISSAKIDFNKSTFNITETNVPVVINPSAKIDYALKDVNPVYNKTPEPGSLVTVNVQFRNVSNYPILKSDVSKIVVSTAGGKDRASDMFVADVWYSKSRAGNLVEDNIPAGEQGTISLPILVRPEAGKQSEKFVLTTMDGKEYANSSFEINLDIPNKNQKVVEVKAVSYGVQNIRDDTKFNAQVIGFTSTGTRHVLLEEQSGWVKIKFHGTKEGWIPTNTIKRV